MKGCAIKKCDHDGKGLVDMGDGTKLCSKHFAEDYNKKHPKPPPIPEDIARDAKAYRAEVIAKMQKASDDFYRAAASAGCHAFIEFTGLMNEFIKVCQDAEAQGIDWTMANTHSGATLPLKSYHVAYLREKLDCVYGPSIAAIVDEMAGRALVLTPAEAGALYRCFQESSFKADDEPLLTRLRTFGQFDPNEEDGIGDHTPIPPRDLSCVIDPNDPIPED